MLRWHHLTDVRQIMTNLRDAGMTSKAWPFEEAHKLVKRFAKKPPEKGYVLFETGYGPSGLPHLGDRA